MNNAQLINQTSGTTEYYTDPRIVKPAQRMVKQFDLDPASSLKANETIRARKIITEPAYSILGYRENLPVRLYENAGGLDHNWYGKVWMNHPFGTSVYPCELNCNKASCIKRGWHTASYIPGNNDWILKLVQEYKRGRITEAFCITFAATSEKWFQPLLLYPQCFLSPRTNYYTPDGKIKKGITKGSVITYLGTRAREFERMYDHLGIIK